MAQRCTVYLFPLMQPKGRNAHGSHPLWSLHLWLLRHANNPLRFECGTLKGPWWHKANVRGHEKRFPQTLTQMLSTHLHLIRLSNNRDFGRVFPFASDLHIVFASTPRQRPHDILYFCRVKFCPSENY